LYGGKEYSKMREIDDYKNEKQQIMQQGGTMKSAKAIRLFNFTGLNTQTKKEVI
jgi:hypothetical protein